MGDTVTFNDVAGFNAPDTLTYTGKTYELEPGNPQDVAITSNSPKVITVKVPYIYNKPPGNITVIFKPDIEGPRSWKQGDVYIAQNKPATA